MKVILDSKNNATYYILIYEGTELLKMSKAANPNVDKLVEHIKRVFSDVKEVEVV